MSSVASSSSLVFTTHRRGQPRIERKTTFRCSSASWSAQEYSDEKKRLKMRALSEAHKSFLGRWHRDASKNENVFEYLEAHDMDGNRSTATYVQVWDTTTDETTNAFLGEGAFTVWTVSSTGTKRKLSYPLGEFVEKYEGESNIFGPGPGEVHRKATWDMSSRTHEVTSISQLGFESTTRTTDESGDWMTCVRRFRKKDGSVDVSCVEHFERTSLKSLS